MTDIKTTYPDRYYASYDIKATQPTIITGWFDTWDMSSVDNVPDASTMIAISEADWNNTDTFRIPSGKGVQNGYVIDFVPPIKPVSLVDQAQNQLGWITEQASMATAMGEVFTDEMKAYVKTIRAIISGSDTISKELPEKPEDIMS